MHIFYFVLLTHTCSPIFPLRSTHSPIILPLTGGFILYSLNHQKCFQSESQQTSKMQDESKDCWYHKLKDSLYAHHSLLKVKNISILWSDFNGKIEGIESCFGCTHCESSAHGRASKSWMGFTLLSVWLAATLFSLLKILFKRHFLCSALEMLACGTLLENLCF